MGLLVGIVSSGGVTNFLPAVVKTLGYNDVHTLLLTSPPYVLCVITSSLNAWHADRTGERFWHITLSLCVALIGFIIAAATTAIGPRYFAIVIMVSWRDMVFRSLIDANALLGRSLEYTAALS
jgi:MFS family permease